MPSTLALHKYDLQLIAGLQLRDLVVRVDPVLRVPLRVLLKGVGRVHAAWWGATPQRQTE